MPHRPTELVLTSQIARRYYLDDRSKTEIADELGISRFRVARLLETARRDGMVEIQINSPGLVNTELSEQLQKAFDLRHAIVLDLPADDRLELRRQLGEIAGEVLSDIVKPGDVVGVAWARSLEGIANHLTKFPQCTVVQLTGALPGPDGSDVLGVVRGLARAGGGTPLVFYAPFVAPDPATARTLRKQSDVARALALASKVTVAAVGIGAWAPGLSSIYDAVGETERAQATRSGVTTEISGVFIDRNGRAVATPLSKRIISLDGQQLAGVEQVLAVAYGDAKADAVRLALAGGWISSIVTHSSLAQRMLSSA